MKPPPFDYVAPRTVAEAVSELARREGDARPLAGGQSLVPMLNFRLVSPVALIDLGRIAALASIEITQSHLRVGAMARTARLLEPEIEAASPVLTAAARLVAHPQIRSRGTVGGSIANADPAAELPAVAVLSDASIRLAGRGGEREVAAGEFFQGIFTTACGWDEIVVAINFPRVAPAAGWGFREFARRPGDFALAGVGAIIGLADDAVSSVAIAAFGIGAAPVRLRRAEHTLVGHPLSAKTLRDASEAFNSELDPDDSPFASANYRRQIARVLFEQVIVEAADRAGGLVQRVGRA